MIPHILISYLALLFISLISKRKLIFLSLASLVVFFSFRTEWIPDTTNYMEMYDNPESHQLSDYGYRVLGGWFGQLTGADFMVFYLSLISSMLIIWIQCTRKLFPKEVYTILLLLFFSFNGYFYFGVTIRSALSSIIVYLALSTFLLINRSYKWPLYFMLLILASFIHKSSLFFLPVIFIANIHLRPISLFVSYGICVCLWFVSDFDFAKGVLSNMSHFEMFSKLDNYTADSLVHTNRFSLQNLMAFFMMFICIIEKNCILPKYSRIYSFFLNINIVGLFVMSLFWHVPTADRFYNMFFFFNFVVFYLVIFQNKLIKYTFLKYSFAVLLSISYFVTLLYSNPFFLLY